VSERPPDFDALVGEDLDATEHERLRRVHELLIAAGPPPEAPVRPPVVPLARRRRGALLAVAVAAAAATFALGVAVGDQYTGRTTDFVVSMSGTGGANGTIEVYEIDDAGNWPMELEVAGLAPPAEGKRYELWLTRAGGPDELCGSFVTDDDGAARVPMNAPWRLDEFDGWVVREQGSLQPVLST
jgi:hypothetical protein